MGLSNDLSMLPAMARNGMDSAIVSMAGHLVDFNEPDKVRERRTLGPRQREILDRWQRETAALGLKFFPMVQLYGTGDRKRWRLERTYVDREGRLRRNTPCPMDKGFWQDKITRVYVEIARWAVSQPNVPGIMMDSEM